MKETEEVTPTCQHCGFQSNKPSYCSLNDAFVPRKGKVCDKFKGGKGSVRR